MTPDALELLTRGLETLGLGDRPQLVPSLDQYAEYLLREHEGLNLVAPGTDDAFVIRHLLDCLAPWREFKPGASVADVGSGGGLPGIPLSLIHGGTVTLIESKAKKAKFLEGAVKALGLSKTKVACKNAAEVKGTFDIITCRAFSEMAHTVKLTKFQCHSKTVYLFYKGRRAIIDGELADLEGFETEILPVTVPGLDGERHLVRVRRKT